MQRLLPLLFLINSMAPASDDTVEFVRDIQPILQARCYECHGADQREGGLRLTNKRDAFTAADSGEPVIVAGHALKSSLLQRVRSDDEADRMPPDGDRLTPEQIDLIQRWIDSGAPWPEESERPVQHWAYRRPVRPPLPATTYKNRVRNPIDDFVFSRLETAGMEPSEPADKARLLRRVSLTLTGLPPTVPEVREFQADDSADAYERAVDRLLASDRYGEHWARQWLDLARYADSNGFQADQLRDSWAYRDWVIDALNADMPYDRFTIEQLAGDLLPSATIDQKIATGFHRTVTCNVEAGVHPEENRTNQVIDRVNTTGTVFLGTTLECCQCHNHKYDPFTQHEYYQLFAYFNNTPLEVKQNSGVSFDFYGPAMDLPLAADQQPQYEALHSELTKLEQQRSNLKAVSVEAQQSWEQRIRETLDNKAAWQTLSVTSVRTTGGESYEFPGDGSVLFTGKVPGNSNYTITVNSELTGLTAFRLDAMLDPSLPGMGPGRGDPERNNFVLKEFEIRAADATVPLALHSPRADFSQQNWDVAGLIDGDLKTGWAIAPQFGKPHWASFRTQSPVSASQLTFTLTQNYGSGRVIGRLKLSGFSGNPDVLDLPEEIAAIVKKQKRSAKESKQIAEFFAATDPERKNLDARIVAVQKKLDALKPPTTLVMQEMEEPRDTNVMIRGEYLNKGRAVEYGTPATLHEMDESLPKNRLGLAQWLVSGENPLVARVAVNRWWADFFGRGIVATLEDFGTQCEPPTHPLLLDWLAVEFMESGWSMKHIHKLMAMSATFQQSSRVNQDLLNLDPENRLLTRGPRFRLAAESIRDNALAVSGLLSTKMHGPPVMPFQPEGIWRQVGRNEPVWKSSTDENRFRRGIYIVYRRAAPYPSFVNFDAPDRGACVASRPRTNTPLQALTLLNDPAYVEMAMSLAAAMLTHSKQTAPRDIAAYGMLRCVSREPTSQELDYLLQVYREESARLAKHPDAVGELLDAVKAVPLPANIEPAELAAWFYVANVLLNLDETITN